ncbi:hypothetical protein GCM10023216_09060 [Isoptericola chiayiensis]|uniref:LPXTG-motif cell wall anchor domain protein n=1 Tax=Isoptericola chiayiensis TaxID=579446 RepID=A0ABP8Y8M4_9MICO
MALALGLAAGPVAVAGPAVAHGGEIDVEIGTDGSGGVSASLVWAGDGHPVEESAMVVVRAVSDDGEEVGPVTLASASEGVGWYRSDAELLEAGHWTVTARVKEPQKTKVTTEIDVVAPPEAPSPEESEVATGADAGGEDSTGQTDDAPAAGSDAEQAAAASSGPDGLPAWSVWTLGALVVAGVLGAVVVRRRRS